MRLHNIIYVIQRFDRYTISRLVFPYNGLVTDLLNTAKINTKRSTYISNPVVKI